MARSYDIADIMTSDGEYITDGVRRKINGNFRRIMQLMQNELPRQQQRAVTSTVTAIVENLLDQRIPEIQGELMDDLMPVGSVIVTYTSSDPRLSHGTWQQVGGGRYVRSAGDDIAVGDTGGFGEVTVDLRNLPVTEVSDTLATDGTEQIDYLAAGSDGDPIEIEPEYIALLFYRRIS